MPLRSYHFDLTKTESRDCVALRYGWDPVKMSSLCAFNEKCTLAHAMHCSIGGYTHMRHNVLCDSFADLLNDFEIEPHIQPLQGETIALKSTTDDDVRLDVKADGLSDSRFNKTFFCRKYF